MLDALSVSVHCIPYSPSMPERNRETDPSNNNRRVDVEVVAAADAVVT